ncbi:zinc finger FYVE domain-containing protein 9 isoform X2 [Trichogramma pretiosum]|uniref:zinc finger FYVE domain-containing protein 9 isoform X2 n=1 Tax=Trichogramma pretiosum TaxID=7493 RepID=UPI0006C943A6|nr:zinc finger FYVE domain-containing protein 9 isoform X2 [Trichogramma pretiosum]
MDKLDNVLDEFEFNDDQTGRMQSQTNSANPAGIQSNMPSSTLRGYPQQTIPNLHNANAEASAIVAGPSLTNDEVHQGFLAGNIDSLIKDGVADSLDSINHFYTHDGSSGNKVHPKPWVHVEENDPTNLIIHNDISEKLLQKRPNDDNLQHNTYDVKLNQPNVNPGNSNNFHNYDYLSTPNISSFDGLDAMNQSPGMQSNYLMRPNEGLSNTVDSHVSNFVQNSNTTQKFSVDDLLTVKDEDILAEIRYNTEPPKYQNILLPVKVGPSVIEKVNETKTDAEQKKLEFPELIMGENSTENVDNSVRNILDEPEHVYENVYIGTDIPKTQENTTLLVPQKKDTESQHIYENMNIEAQSLPPLEKKNVYECIYIGSEDNLSNTNSEVETSAEKMIHQLNLKETEPSDPNVIVDSITSSSAVFSENPSTSTKLVFQNVQSSSTSVSVPEPRSVVGFTTIDDMSEEELNKYLADLEAKEILNEKSVMYQNVDSTRSAETNKPKALTRPHEDEDANEAPIFESVTIGELPQIPQEDLQEKAKKFPVIDYSEGCSSGEVSREFPSNLPTISKAGVQAINDADVLKQSKKVDEHARKNSQNNESSLLENDVSVDNKDPLIKDKITTDEENSNMISPAKSDETQNELGHSNVNSEEDNNFNCAGTTHSGLDNSDPSDKEKSKQNINNAMDLPKPAVRPKVRSFEKISRFSVTRNVDVNEKIGRPSQSQNRSKRSTENSAESTEDDPNKPSRPQTLDIASNADTSATAASNSQIPSDLEGECSLGGRIPSPAISDSNSSIDSRTILGKQPPFWIPDSEAPSCMLCEAKFTVMKRRHHCRACGKVLCNKCCSMKYRLEYLNNADSRVCTQCHQILTKAESDNGSGEHAGFSSNSNIGINSPIGRPPNPNNPMEYCSTIPPLQQLAGALPPPPTVMVPVGVLKREGSSSKREGPKSVMFSDGIRPGCDLTELDTAWDWNPPIRKSGSRRTVGEFSASASKRPNCPPLDTITNSYIPSEANVYPPTVTILRGQVTYHETTDPDALQNSLKNECEAPVMFAINRNLYAYVKIINLNCCVDKVCWNVTTKGLACVGQDELVFLVEVLPDEALVPKDILLHINQIYNDALKGNTISEYGMSIHQTGNLLGSREHAGFLFIRQTLQCLQKIIVPPAPFLVGLLVHRWETPWAKVFPLRLVLRLGAEYRYYPCPLMSVRFREAVYFEIGHTIMKVLADFRNFAYTLPKVQGLTIHVQGRTTNVRFPKNRYNQVLKALNNSNDHVLSFAANFSIQADSHLVCMQTNSEEESTYQTQAINIQNKPRNVTGASFIVINGALKSSMGLTANSSILEDGLMVQIMPEKMEALKAALKNMQDFTIGCGKQGAEEPDETVNIKWVENDVQFNVGIKSPIDGKPMDGIPSIRVHNGINFAGTSRFIRWTEVFIIKSDDDQPFGMHYPVDINKLSENIARATCAALVKLLDLLANAGLTKIAVRTSIHPDNVGYEAGSEGVRLPPIYMNSLDNELIQVLQKAVQGCEDTQTVLELIFYILETDI